MKPLWWALTAGVFILTSVIFFVMSKNTLKRVIDKMPKFVADEPLVAQSENFSKPDGFPLWQAEDKPAAFLQWVKNNIGTEVLTFSPQNEHFYIGKKVLVNVKLKPNFDKRIGAVDETINDKQRLLDTIENLPNEARLEILVYLRSFINSLRSYNIPDEKRFVLTKIYTILIKIDYSKYIPATAVHDLLINLLPDHNWPREISAMEPNGFVRYTKEILHQRNLTKRITKSPNLKKYKKPINNSSTTR